MPLYHGVATHEGGNTIVCPTTQKTVTNTLVITGAINHVNFWELTGAAYDAAITIPTQVFVPKTMIDLTTVTAARNYTVPTAANLIAYLLQVLHEPPLGSTTYTFRFAANGANVTLITNTGVTLKGNTTVPVIASGTTRTLYIRLTDLRPGNEAYELWIV